MFGSDESGAVVSVLIEVKFVGDAMLVQGRGVELGVLGGNELVLPGVPEKYGRQSGADLEFT